MKISKENFYKFINNYTEDEVFYRYLYEVEQKSSSKLANFINQLDLEIIKKNQLYVPSLHTKWFDHLKEDQLVDDICILKHNRYTPAFIHEHEFYEIIYVYQGSCKNTIEDVNELICVEGDVCIIPPKTKHSIAVFDSSIILNIIIKSSTFHMSFFDLFTHQNDISQFFSHVLYSNTENNYLLFRTDQDKRIKSLIEDIYIEAIHKQKYYQNFLKSHLLTFWGLLLRHHEANIQSFLNVNDKHLKVMGILIYIQDHFQTLTLQKAADYFGFSPSHFSKMIKESTGQSFIQIIKGIKLDKACELLKETNLTITSICELIGYNNSEHFTRTFKTTFNITPGEYRKMYRLDSLSQTSGKSSF